MKHKRASGKIYLLMPVAFLKKLLFFKEKTFLEIEKKILLSTTNTLKPAQTNSSKVFWLLFSKK